MRACVRREWRLGDDRGATADAVVAGRVGRTTPWARSRELITDDERTPMGLGGHRVDGPTARSGPGEKEMLQVTTADPPRPAPDTTCAWAENTKSGSYREPPVSEEVHTTPEPKKEAIEPTMR